MGIEKLVFYLLSAVLITSSVMVITVRNSVRAALFLVLAFFTSAAIWLAADAEFLAIVLVLVYVGAVMVLFLFVVMMLDVDEAQLREGFGRHLPVGLLVAGVIIAELVLVLGPGNFGLEQIARPQDAAALAGSNVKAIGRVLYTDYVYAFEIAAVILLVGIVAAISLTLRGRRQTKYMSPGQQVAARREDRVRLVSIPSGSRDTNKGGSA